MQKNHDRAIVQESVLPAPSDLSPRPGRAFTFITRSLCLQALARKRVSAAPFRSRNYWTPRSVFRDGSKNSGSPFAPLIGRFSVRRRPLVRARASPPLMRASQPNQPLTASPARSFGLRHAHRVDCQPGSYPVHAHPVQPCRRQPIYRARPFQSVHMGLLSRIAARVRQSIWPQPTASEAITRDTSTKRDGSAAPPAYAATFSHRCDSCWCSTSAGTNTPQEPPRS